MCWHYWAALADNGGDAATKCFRGAACPFKHAGGLSPAAAAALVGGPDKIPSGWRPHLTGPKKVATAKRS